jgi:hypothetical protein
MISSILVTNSFFITNTTGLYHTFEAGFDTDACDIANPGDFIDDTPQQVSEETQFYCSFFLIQPLPLTPELDSLFQANSTALVDCATFLAPLLEPFPDTCPDRPGLDPVFNYVSDYCMFLVQTKTCLFSALANRRSFFCFLDR